MKLCSFGHDKYKTDSESFGDEPNDAQLALHCKRQQQTSKGNFATGPAGGGGGRSISGGGAEGRRFFDLVRNGIVVQVMDPIIKSRKPDAIGFGADTRTILWPLNIAVLNANPKLVQNAPYN